MSLRKFILGATCLLGLFVFLPNVAFAADWSNIGFAGRTVKDFAVAKEDNKHIVAIVDSNGDGQNGYYTVDGGNTWSASTPGSSICYTLLQNPGRTNEYWKGCTSGLLRSIDGGKTFSLARYHGSGMYYLTSANDGKIYYSYSNQVYASSDGLLWQSGNLPNTVSTVSYISVNPGNSNEVFAQRTGTGDGLFRSVDGGLSWSVVSRDIQFRNGINGLYFLGNNTLVVTHLNSGISFSTDSGFTWSAFRSPDPNVTLEYNHAYLSAQNPDIPSNFIVSSRGNADPETSYYSLVGNDPTKTTQASSVQAIGALRISQGVLFSASPSSGITRNDGIATKPEYLIKYPIIIVPGILGSWWSPFTGRWELDPFTHTYDSLYSSLVNAGYEPDKTVFRFPYDWRNDNRTTAVMLKGKINEAKALSGSSKVNIIAHSMGGIVSRVYLEGDSYQYDVDRVFFLGTPQLGSVDSYYTWEGGHVSGSDSLVFQAIFRLFLAEEAAATGRFGDIGIVQYIQHSVTSVGQLLPIFEYYSGPKLPPQNLFLTDLLAASGRIKERGVAVTNIYGETGVTTLSGLTMVESRDPFMWVDGIPKNILSANSFDGVTFAHGDGTVTNNSQLAISGHNILLNGVSHREIPNNSIKVIFEELEIDGLPLITETINKYVLIKAYSPVDFYVESPSGKRIGYNKNGDTFQEVSGAFYSGNESAAEFVVIPNPEVGAYRIVTEGNDTGGYKIESTYIDESLKTEETRAYSGFTESGSLQTITATLSDKGLIDTKVVDTAPPVTVLSQSVETADYYNKEVVIHLSAKDDISGVRGTEYSLDGITWNTYSEDFLISKEGNGTLYYRSVDYAGNIEPTNTGRFVIDKSPPIVSLKTNKAEYTHYEIVKLFCSAADSISGIDTAVVNFEGIDHPCANQIIELTQMKNGNYEVRAKSRDRAGNEVTVMVSFRVVSTFSSTQMDLFSLLTKKKIPISLHIKYSNRLSAAELLKRIGLVKQSNMVLDNMLRALEMDKKLKIIPEHAYNLIKGDFLWLREK